MSDRAISLKRGLVRLGGMVLIAACSADPATAPPTGLPPGQDTAQPFPIDRGDDGPRTPGSYKGLPLRLVDNGTPAVTAVDGVIGLVCVGMSNASQECGMYVARLRGGWSGEVNPQVRVVNCAVGGHAIERWNDPEYDAVLWDDCIARRLPAAGIHPGQVRVLYHKAANQFTTRPDGGVLPQYPASGSDYDAFVANLTRFAQRVPQKFPSVQAVYTTSRSYGGWAPHAGRGEPLSYEEGHALNSWLRQNAAVAGVWHGWGPYIWAPECATGVTNATGMCYNRADYMSDGVHPTPAGELRIAAAIHARFRQFAWYRR
jgi:hypothetical protein